MGYEPVRQSLAEFAPPPTHPSPFSIATAQIDSWLETMRCPGGYGGPVAHWWHNSLLYTGSGLDWRYEGIIAGYLTLWDRTGDEKWLLKARRAGDDLISGQLPSGNYIASAFEINPATAGTPHEAACDIGLLLLARALVKADSSGWGRYVASAERNLREFYIGKLWDPHSQSITDHPNASSFVPNKAATASEALFLMAEISGDDLWVERYALPTLDRILFHQVQERGVLHGAIAQNSFSHRKTENYFPIYIARCIPALLKGTEWSGDARYAAGALQAMEFLARWVFEDGSFPTVVYSNKRDNRYPSWIAALADILRVADELQPYGFEADLSATEQRLLSGCDLSGGVQTATGFAAQAGGSPPKIPEVRDVLHVAGWCDKAFRYLASRNIEFVPAVQTDTFECECTFRGQLLLLIETSAMLEIKSRKRIFYRWVKGETWPEIATDLFWLR